MFLAKQKCVSEIRYHFFCFTQWMYLYIHNTQHNSSLRPPPTRHKTACHGTKHSEAQCTSLLLCSALFSTNSQLWLDNSLISMLVQLYARSPSWPHAAHSSPTQRTHNISTFYALDESRSHAETQESRGESVPRDRIR